MSALLHQVQQILVMEAETILHQDPEDRADLGLWFCLMQIHFWILQVFLDLLTQKLLAEGKRFTLSQREMEQ